MSYESLEKLNAHIDSRVDKNHAERERAAELESLRRENEELRQAQQAPAAPLGKPKSDNGAPRPIQDFDSLTDPNQLTADDVRRLEAKMGKVKAWNHIRQMAENHYRDRPIQTEGR